MTKQNEPISLLWRSAITLVIMLYFPGYLAAQELEARSLSNTPVGMNFVAIGYGFSSGNILLDPALPVENLDANIHALFGAYVRSINLFGMSGKVDVALPFSPGDWKYTLAGVEESRKIDGFGDPRVRLTFGFKGAPALRPAEFRNYTQRIVVGAIFQVSVPVGQYDSPELINLGTNRWGFRTEVGISQDLGKWTVETYVGSWFYTANKAFLGDNTLTQKPLLVAKAHLTRSFPRGRWVTLDLGYGHGGRTSINGEPKNTRISSFVFGATLTFPFAARHAFKFSLASAARIEAGPEFTAIGVLYQYRWGGK